MHITPSNDSKLLFVTPNYSIAATFYQSWSLQEKTTSKINWTQSCSGPKYNTNSAQAHSFIEQATGINQQQNKLYVCSALRGVRGHSDKYATGHFPEAQCAFKVLMIHEVLQFALRIAFRCVLHRCGSLDIRC